MSLLTQIYTQKAKYRTNQGRLTKAQGTLRDLYSSRSSAVRKFKAYQEGDYATATSALTKAQEAYTESVDAFDIEKQNLTTKVQSFVDTYKLGIGSAGGVRSRGGTRVASADDLPEVINLEDYMGEGGQEKFNEIATSYYKSRVAEFNKDERASREYYGYMNVVASGGAGSMMSTLYERAKPYIEQFERTVTKPYETLVSDVEDIGAFAGEEGAYGKAYANVESMADTLSTRRGEYESAAKQLRSYYDVVYGTEGLNAQIKSQIQALQGFRSGMTSAQAAQAEAERMYGVSNEQRKRGTRASAQRRSALTSRSSYA